MAGRSRTGASGARGRTCLALPAASSTLRYTEKTSIRPVASRIRRTGCCGAFRLALASHGRTGAPASSAGAVQAAVAGAWGGIPLVLLVAGLAAYALTQLLEAVFRAARATGTMGKWRQPAVSSWGFLLYSAFCLSTARLLAGTPAKQTAQSEQRQDTGMARGLAAHGMGQGAARRGGDPCRGGRPGSGPPCGSARFPGAVHRRAHVPGAGHGHAGPRRVRLGRALWCLS